jgi:hypothetical protein
MQRTPPRQATAALPDELRRPGKARDITGTIRITRAKRKQPAPVVVSVRVSDPTIKSGTWRFASFAHAIAALRRNFS